DGISVNEHFGRAALFYIYGVNDDGSFRLTEKRAITQPSSDEPEAGHGVDVTIEQLSDVHAVLVAQIGPGAQSSLNRKGVRSFALGGPIDKALSSYGRRHKLLDVTIPGMPDGYSADKRASCSSKKRCCK
ncbi:MAG: NifB/NifX family molybdenum-iron cluster-binding protein, partial [Desulfuromonadaceae bacterium]